MTIQTVCRSVVIGGLFLLFAVPFVVTDSMFFPFITGKNFVFRILVEIVVAAWAILALWDARYRPRGSFLMWAFAAFVALLALANIFGVDVMRSIWSNFERMEGFVTLLHVWGLFVVVASFLHVEGLWIRFLKASVGASVIMGIYALFQLLGIARVTGLGSVRIDGTLGNATYLAAYMLFNIFIVLFLLVRRGTNLTHKRVLLYGGIALIQFSVLYFTGTRGAMLGVLGGAVLTGILSVIFMRGRSKLRKGILAGLLIIIIGIPVLLFGIRGTQFAEENYWVGRYTDLLSVEEIVNQPRFVLWGVAWEGFKERPILGWGQENFPYIFSHHYDEAMHAQEPWFDRAHNVFFDWLTAGGILGLLAYLSLFIGAVVLIWRGSTYTALERSVLTGLLAAYFFHNLFVFDNVTSYFLFVVVLGYIHAQSLKEKGTSFVIPESLRYGGSALILILLVGALYVFTVPGVRASQSLIEALQLQGYDPAAGLEAYEHALTHAAYARPEIRERLVITAQQVGGSSLPIELKEQFYTAAYTEMQQQLQERPQDARLHLFMGGFLNHVGRHDEAGTVLERTLELAPYKEEIVAQLIATYFVLGESEKAFALAEEAFERAPEFDHVRKQYAQVAIQTGRVEEGERVLVEAYGSANIPDREFIRMYALLGDYDRMRDLLILGSPEISIQTWAEIAGLLAQQGVYGEAISLLEEAAEREPGFKAQADIYIEQIRAIR